MPLYWLLAAYAAGISWAVLRPFTVDRLPLGLLAAGLCLTWAGLRRSPSAWLPLLGGAALCAYLATLQAIEPPRSGSHIARFATNEPLIVEARLLAAERDAEGGARLVVEALGVVRDRQRTPAEGRLRLTIGQGVPAAEPGQVVRWRSRIRRPRRFGTPGEFDYPLHLASQQIYATAFVEQAEELAVLPAHPASRRPFWARQRTGIARLIEASVDQEMTGLVKALTVGMRAGIGDERRRLIAEGGVAHLFAISGLHFGLVGLLLYAVGSWFYRRSERLILWMPPRRLLPSLVVIPLLGYLLLTGSSWSTLRAFVMAAGLAILLMSQRRTPPLAVPAAAALVLLTFHPLALFQPGFQLSFAGLAGILCWYPPWQTRLGKLPPGCRWPAALLLTTAAATLATTPFVLWHFHQFAPAGLLSNLLAIPVIAWGAVPAGLFGMLLSGLSPALAAGAFQASARLVSLALDWVGWTLSLPGLQAIHVSLTLGEMVCLCILLGALFLKDRVRDLPVPAVLLTATALLIALAAQKPQDALQVTALSVGQGDATLVSFPGGRHFLVDGGGMPGSHFDPGERLVAPALGRLGVRRLQGVILTHDHPDHRDGLVYVLEHLPVAHFWSALDWEGLHPDLRRVLGEREIAWHRLPEGWSTVLDGDTLRLSLFTPRQNSRDVNERSVVVLAGDARNRALLTGDLGPDGLGQLAAGLTGPVSLLKLPHHGSRHSVPARLLEALEGETAFVSVGAGNAYGFPHPATIEACAARGVPLHRTDQEGTLVFTSQVGGWRLDAAATRL